ncbi:cytochrome c oxidase assembly factor 8 isoform X4 [Phyllopteryx taeniolatus]|uniref:cytochrome c oxidase assembly factor 8 isoform X4 n=1 Tax=Phyllopteryx taeniolatus TaxID=161469 RepID=UPI002AD4B451|nr:cytochrome c oxidase assembly factor 8 isoform X4 [Phyllopteryx taeniolatus]
MSFRAAAGCWTLRRWRCLRTRQSVTAAASRRQCSKLATKQQDTSPKEKEAFIVSQLKAKGLTERHQQGRRTLSSEEMSVFYKNFLDKNRERHASYNKSVVLAHTRTCTHAPVVVNICNVLTRTCRKWYRRNLSITVLMARVALHKLWKTIVNKHHNTPTT